MKEIVRGNNYGLVSVLLATYNPNIKWLELQIASIMNQSYDNIELLILDDCSSETFYRQIENIIETDDHRKIKLYRSNVNCGSNKTFEKLTGIAQGEFIAYCDQDDIWHRDKISILLHHLIAEKAVMAYSDVEVIDQDGKVLANSLKTLRKRLVYRQGDDLTKYYIFANCTAGCTMLVRASIARGSIPFLDNVICDHWIAINSAVKGKIYFEPTPLVQYRQHNDNQSGVLRNIYCKRDYYNMRVLPAMDIVNELKRRELHYANEEDAYIFAKARFEHTTIKIWSFRDLNKKSAYFEVALIFLPDIFVRRLFSILRER